jgi:lysozyme family protein
MSEFKKALDLIFKLEGYDTVTNDPDDPGGLTKWGISKRAHPEVDVENLTREGAGQIYHRDYWEMASCDRLPWPLNLFVFDAAVNQGVIPAKKMLQAATGRTAADGIFGPKTMAAIAHWPSDELAARFMAKRALRYVGTRNFDKYGYGWLKRLALVAMQAHDG